MSDTSGVPLGSAGDDRQLRLLRSIVAIVSEPLDLEVLGNRVAEVVLEAVDGDACFVHLLSPDSRHLNLIGASAPFDALVGTVVLPLGEGVAGWVALNRVPAIVPDKWHDSRYIYLPELRGEDYQSLISVPMLRGSTSVVGVLNVHWRESLGDFDSMQAILLDVAHLLAGAIESAHLHSRLAQREADISRYARESMEATETERKRIAAEIHDGVGQVLVSMLFHLDAAVGEHEIDSGKRSSIERAKELANTAISEVRRTISALRPTVIDDFGLAGGLEQLAASFPHVVIKLEIQGGLHLDAGIEAMLYRIAQEALSNAIRHSSATSIGVRLGVVGGRLQLGISDFGNGFDLDSRGDGYGLRSMRERAELIGGTFEIYSKPEQGTRILVTMPFESS